MPSQSTSIKGRQILDEALVANAVVNWAQHFKKLLLKVDFMKAYNFLNWDFLDTVLEQMRFSAKWHGWVHRCISSARIFMLVNGSPTQEFGMERGLCQGDPLSPFLFIIAVEAMSVMMAETVDAGLFKPGRVGSMALPILLLC